MTEKNQTETPEVVELPTIMKHETLVEALAYAQLEYEPLVKNEEVDFTTKEGRRIQYRYAGLASMRAATDPHLNKHGLVVTDRTETRDGGKEFLISTLRHAFSDEFDETEIEISISSGDMKDMAANMTYAKRYNYGNLTGRVAEEDNDARDVRRQETQQPQQSNKQPDSKNKPLDAAKTAYFALLSKNKVFKDDTERHAWQELTPYGKSTEQWKLADVKDATDLMNWRIEVGLESDELLGYITHKSTKALKKPFLAIMNVSKLTDIKDVSQWKIGMASAKLSIDHTMEAALDMGKVLMRAGNDLFVGFLQEVEVDKLSKLNAAQVESWEPFLKLAVDKYNGEHAENTVDFDKLFESEEEKV